MAEAIGVAGSIVGIVAFGLQLGVTLQTYVEAAAEASDRLREIAFEINSTAAVLSQLQDVINKDGNGHVPLFKMDGVLDIKRLSDRCKRIYSVIIILLNEATEGSENRKTKREVSADGVDNLSVKLNKLGFRRKLAWPWLAPRIKRCQQQLRQVKLDLFLHIQLVNLAQFQIHHSARAPGSFEEEQALTELAQELRRKRSMHAKQLKRHHDEKADKATAAVAAEEPGTVAAPPGETIRVSTQSEIPPLPPTTRQDARAGQHSKDGLNEPKLALNPEPHDIEPSKESDKPKSQEDRNIVDFAAPPPDNGSHNREAPLGPPIPMSSQSLDSVHLRSCEVRSEDHDNPRHDEEGTGHGSTRTSASVTFSNQIRQTTIRLIPTWARGIFSRKWHDDWESDELEAFLLEVPARIYSDSPVHLMKLEIGHRQLEAALSTIMPRRWRRGRPQLWEKYKTLGPRVRSEIHHAIKVVKRGTNQRKSWIAIEVMQPPVADPQDSMHVVLFFRLGEETKPINLDAVGRKFTLPYEHCRTWEMMEDIIVSAFSNTDLDDQVQDGRYDIVNADTDAIILPETWRSAVLPGMDLKINMLPPMRRHFTQAPPQQKAPPQPAQQKARPQPAPPPPQQQAPPQQVPPLPQQQAPPQQAPPPPQQKVAHRPPPPGFPGEFTPPPGVPGWPGLSPRSGPSPSMVIHVLSSDTTDGDGGFATDSESTTHSDKDELDEEMEGLLGLEERSTDEINTSNLGLGELLKRWTNAPDASRNDELSLDMSDTEDLDHIDRRSQWSHDRSGNGTKP
ncbi:hypothetical protein B0T10DRAFT_502154 [Thelonectria olida]|uniref:Ubiquitin-like domain-containing protein n=1 Tax=Thelonectria olida TaxID=1576542 RepID=A0A9P9AGI3_9HYPO|nr:hypothetical protein B0T10DRAFT_502154 [Thelonectria olida]